MLVLVDYDDTILRNGSIDRDMIEYLTGIQRTGGKVMLWTARTGESLDEAVRLCKSYGLEFDDIAMWKHVADMYIDDKAVRPEEVVKKKSGRNVSRQRLTSLRGQRK